MLPARVQQRGECAHVRDLLEHGAHETASAGSYPGEGPWHATSTAFIEEWSMSLKVSTIRAPVSSRSPARSASRI